jgi:hypothetical protein
VPGYDPTDSDRVNAKLTGGEFVLKRQAVDYYGPSLLHKLNNMRMPRLPGYATGGSVSVPVAQEVAKFTTPIVLNIGTEKFDVMADDEVASALVRFINQEGGL